MRKAVPIVTILASAFLAGCSTPPDRRAEEAFDRGVAAVGRSDAIVRQGEAGARLLVSPRLQARVMNTQVGAVGDVGWINDPEIAEGETHPSFNNFGGQDRFWLGPEAGNFGIYFAPGAEFDRKVWKVPPDFDTGTYTLVERGPAKVVFTRDMTLTNYAGTIFKVKVRREVGLVPASTMTGQLTVTLPPGVAYAGSYSDNTMTNTGTERWQKDKGLLNIWILGQFVPGPNAAIIAPFTPGEGQPYRDELYFGKIPADRLKTLGRALIFRADAMAEGKLGIPQARTTGLAGSFDFDRNLLVIVRCDVPAEPALYGDSTWVKNQAAPYAGDLFQTYNANRKGTPDQRAAFYELESVSPSRELAPGDQVRHRHATFCFQGDYAGLREVARKVLGVDLDEVRKAMGF